MRILVLDLALAGGGAALIEGDRLLADGRLTQERGQAALLARLVADLLGEVGWIIPTLGLIGVTVGPGSFTGIRAALSLAHGLSLGGGVPLAGVTVGEALAAAVDDGASHGRAVWSAIDSRRGHVFLERDGDVGTCGLDRLPQPEGPILVTGDAAPAVAAQLAARQADVLLSDVRTVPPLGIARAAWKRHTALLPPREAQPLYVDAPAVTLPASRPS